MLDVDLACDDTVIGGHPDVVAYTNQLAGAGGEHAADGHHPLCPWDGRQAVTGQTGREFGVMLTELPAAPGASVLRMTVKAVPSEEHAAYRETATALLGGE